LCFRDHIAVVNDFYAIRLACQKFFFNHRLICYQKLATSPIYIPYQNISKFLSSLLACQNFGNKPMRPQLAWGGRRAWLCQKKNHVHVATLVGYGPVLYGLMAHHVNKAEQHGWASISFLSYGLLPSGRLHIDRQSAIRQARSRVLLPWCDATQRNATHAIDVTCRYAAACPALRVLYPGPCSYAVGVVVREGRDVITASGWQKQLATVPSYVSPGRPVWSIPIMRRVRMHWYSARRAIVCTCASTASSYRPAACTWCSLRLTKYVRGQINRHVKLWLYYTPPAPFISNNNVYCSTSRYGWVPQ